jgi:hypothetical protein
VDSPGSESPLPFPEYRQEELKMTKVSVFQSAKEIGMQEARRTAPGIATLGAILTVFLTTSAVMAQAPAPNCSQATLSGTYVNTGTGTMAGISVVTVGQVTYDGHGNGASTFTKSVGGVITKSVAVPGVYTVNADCTGSKIFGGATTYDFVVTPDGREITWIVTNSSAGMVFTGHAVRLDSTGVLHVTKECSQDKGAAGDFCTITSSNLAAITVGSKVFYDQAAGIPTGLLDSNVVLDAGSGNRAVGHCTLDQTTHLGLCRFSDGTGQFTGFQARVDVDCTSGCRWDGTYSFSPQPPR